MLTAETTALFRAVADRWGGSFVDVVRLGVPSRHARAEAEPTRAPPAPAPPGAHGFGRYRAGAAFLAAVADGRPARAVWSALPGEDWPARIAEAVQTAVAAGRGAIAVVPDARDLARLDAAFTAALGRAAHVALSADLGPAERYRRWLAVRRGAVRAVIGTRAAAYAPVADLGLLAIWDDGDDLYDEPRAPYAHTRDVLVLRARRWPAARCCSAGSPHRRGAAAGRDRLGARDRRRARRPCARPLRGSWPPATTSSWPAIRPPQRRGCRAWPGAPPATALEAGAPVLVQVPRRGLCPGAGLRARPHPGPLRGMCRTARRPGARCRAHCRWCGRPAGDWRCPNCGGRAMRAVVVGARRTAEELGRAFPGTAVRTSGGDRVLAERAPRRPELVVATPGAEPVADGGYGAALLLDGWALLTRADLRAGEETLRRWMAAAALVRPGGTVVVGADAGVAGRAGAGALGPGRLRCARAGRPGRARLPAGRPDGHAHWHAGRRRRSAGRGRAARRRRR